MDIESQFPLGQPSLTPSEPSDRSNLLTDREKKEQSIKDLEALIWSERENQHSIPNQLANPLRRALIGVQIPAKEKEQEEGVKTEVITGLMDIFSNLTQAEAATDLISWVTKEAGNNNPEQLIYFVQTLLHFSTLLDLETYAELAKGKDGTSRLPLLTIYACAAIIDGNTQLSKPQFLNYDAARNLFNAQFALLLAEPLSQEIPDLTNIQNRYKFLPEAIDIAYALYPLLEKQVAEGRLTQSKALRAMLNYLEMYDATNIGTMLKQLESRLPMDDIFFKELKYRAIEFNLMDATPEEIRAVLLEGITEIRAKKVTDVDELRYEEYLKPNTELLKILILTGSLAPYHRCHLHTTEIVLELMEEQGLFDPNSHAQGLFYIAPIVSPHKLDGTFYEKKAAQIGDHRRRVEAIIAATRHVAVEITTLTQPDPNFAKQPIARLRGMQTRTLRRLDESLERAGQRATLGVTFERVVGIDKMISRDTNSNTCSVKDPRGEYLGPSIVKCRRGYLACALQELSRMRELYPDASFILTPDMPKGSSTEAILNNDFTAFSILESAIFNGYWQQDAIERRSQEEPLEDKVYSVTQIYEQLLLKLDEIERALITD